jgi:hypothetical protein
LHKQQNLSIFCRNGADNALIGGEAKGKCKYIVQMFRLENSFNPILHTWFRDSCFTCDGSSTIQVFPFLFNIGIVEVPNSQRISCLDSSLGRVLACGAGGLSFAP